MFTLLQVPFGHVPAVRDWMKLNGSIFKPEVEYKDRSIEGFNCLKAEQSGLRFWGVIQQLCETPENFFKHCFVYNWCPLAFFDGVGRNITPQELKADLKKPLIQVCNKHLKETLDLIEPTIIISVGKFVEKQIEELLKEKLLKPNTRLLFLRHPSPRSLNNTNWVKDTIKWLNDHDIVQFFK